MFDADHLSLPLKIRLYITAVCSILTYGAETWALTNTVLRQLNGANSLMLARITGRSIPTEARPTSTTYNLTLDVRRRHFKWLGEILRPGNPQLQPNSSRLVYQLLEEQHADPHPGDLFMDAPPTTLFPFRAINAGDEQIQLEPADFKPNLIYLFS